MDEYTGADSFAFKLTGASAHDGTQTDPDASLGNHVSSTVVQARTATDMNPNLGSCPMTIERLGGKNAIGTGTITAVTADTVTWTPPGSSVGAAVEILNGQTKQVTGSDKDEYIVLTRNSATSMTTTAQVSVIQVYPNAWGFDDVSDSERTAGDDEYRCVALENMSSVTIKDVELLIATLGTERTTDTTVLPASGVGTIECSGSLADWPDTGWAAIFTSASALREVVYYSSRTSYILTVPAAGRARLGTSAAAGATSDTIEAIPGIRIQKEAPASQPSGAYTTSADEDTAPSGITFALPIKAADAISVGDLAPNYTQAVWIEREITAGMTSGIDFEQAVRVLGDAA